jgi:prepilin-type N-terminal cleavage/methylation domain-containing protein
MARTLTITTVRHRPPRRRGFTLIETALATVIIGVGVLAMVAAQQAFHQKNRWAMQASTAQRLGNEIRELTLNLPAHDPVTGTTAWGPEANETGLADFDDLDDFDGDEGEGSVFSAALGNGPINARSEIIPEMEGWSQTVRVFNVDPFDTTETVDDFGSNFIKVEVTVHFQGVEDAEPVEMTRVSWIAPK